MRGKGSAGARKRDIDKVLLVAQAPEGGHHGRVEVVPPQRVLLLAAGRGAACAIQSGQCTLQIYFSRKITVYENCVIFVEC